MQSIHTMEYYSAIQRNGVLIDVTAWMNPEHMLNEKKKASHRRPHIADSIYMKCLEQANPQTESRLLVVSR